MSIIRRQFLLGATSIPLALAAPAAAASPASVDSAAPAIAKLVGIRTAKHDAFDRIVLDMKGPRPGVSSSWGATLRADPSGQLVWLYGCRFLTVRCEPAAAHNDEGEPTYTGPRKFRTTTLSNVMAVALIGDFEAVLSIGIGARKQTKVRTFTLGSPTRVIIDVWH